MTSREQIYVFETIKAMKKKIARDAIGELPYFSQPICNVPPRLSCSLMPSSPSRIRLRLRNPGTYK